MSILKPLMWNNVKCLNSHLILYKICYLSIFGGKGNGLEHHPGSSITIRKVIKLVGVVVIEVGVFFIIEVI